jgi:hypothetical protein
VLRSLVDELKVVICGTDLGKSAIAQRNCAAAYKTQLCTARSSSVQVIRQLDQTERINIDYPTFPTPNSMTTFYLRLSSHTNSHVIMSWDEIYSHCKAPNARRPIAPHAIADST